MHQVGRIWLQDKTLQRISKLSRALCGNWELLVLLCELDLLSTHYLFYSSGSLRLLVACLALWFPGCLFVFFPSKTVPRQWNRHASVKSHHS